MARAYSHDTNDAPEAKHLNADDDGHHPVRRRTTAMTSARRRAKLGLEPAATTAGTHLRAHPHPQPQPLDLKALRLAVHGWWLGNPLVYKPGVADLMAVARELASASAASGTLVLSDAPAGSERPASDDTGTLSDAKTTPYDTVHAVHMVLILRPPTPLMPPTPGTLLGAVAAQTVAEVAQGALGRPCSVRWRWEVVLRDGGRVASRLCRVSAEQDEDVALVEMRLALGPLWQVSRDDADQPSAALFLRSDWREVFIARALHALDGRLRELQVA